MKLLCQLIGAQAAILRRQLMI